MSLHVTSVGIVTGFTLVTLTAGLRSAFVMNCGLATSAVTILHG